MHPNHESPQETLCTNPTSESQQEIINAINLFGHEGNLCFNESVTLTFDGLLNEETFCLAINRLIQRHDALRTTFSQDGREFYVHKHLPAKIELINYSHSADADKKVKIQEQEAVKTEFDIVHGPLVKATVIKLKHKHMVVLSVHHIICDGWSYAVFLEDLAKIYAGLTSRTHMGLPEPHYYIDYLHSITTPQHIKKLELDYGYWLNLYKKVPHPLELPTDNPQQAIRSLQSNLVEYQFNLESCNNIKALAQHQSCSVVIVLLAAYASLIYKISNQRDIVIALPAAGQAIEGWYRVIGHCVNTLPILCQVDPETSFKQFLHSFKTTFLDSCDHQSISLGGLLRKLNIKRDSSRLPLASLMFNLDQDMEKFNFSQLEARVHPNGRAFENFELFLNVVEKENGFLLQWQYNTALFKQTSITAWAKAYHSLLQQMCGQPELSIDSFKLGISQDFNHQSIPATPDICTEESAQGLIQKLITKPHINTHKLAIIYGNNHLNYQQLNEQSNQLANFLIEKNVNPGDLIGICMHRTIELIPTLLAIWKCGCAYVPLDPTYPRERLDYVTNASNIKTIISHSKLVDLIKPRPDLNILCTDQHVHQINSQSTNLPSVDFDPEALAYVIFTSGSTGKPKGVMVSQYAVANFIESMAERPGMKSDDRLLAITTLSFDISVLEIFLPLWVGGAVIIASAEQSKNATDLMALIESHEISIMQATPSTWQMLLNSNWHGCKTMKLLCGGETFSQPLAKALFPCASEIWNMYGPTETTVWSTCFRIDNPNEPILIGEPIKNTQCYILDQNMDPLPDNFQGELCIGGHGVSSGYLNQVGLTDERFISISANNVSTRIYRTGDKARWNHENQLEIFGRMDNQVKIRGYRIELGEIESSLSEFPWIKENAVVVSDSGTDKKIIAYYTSNKEISGDYKLLRKHLKRNLPDYMLPVSFVSLEILPKLPNGKIDRKFLAGLKVEPQSKPSSQQVQGEQEKIILSIWQEVLDRQDIGRHDSFFEMGGHSLLIGQVINQVRAKIGVQLTYRDVYLTPTIELLAKYIEQSQSHAQELIPVIPGDNPSSLSFAQQRLWYMEKLSNVKTLYNLPTAFRMRGSLNKHALLNSFNDLINQQQALRTIIVENAGKPEQQVVQNFEYHLEQIDLQNVQDQENLLTKKILQLSDTEFQLDQFPLFKAALFILSEDEHVIFFVAHHIIFDGWSFDIFLHELTNQYCFHAGFPAQTQPLLDFQYTDYSTWLFDWSKSEEFQQKQNYWLNNLQGNLPVLELITDKPRPEIESQHGDVVYFELEKSLLESLEIIANKQDVSIFMIFLACYNILLHKYTQQDDIIVGVPMADRTRYGTEKLIGLFVNTMVLRFQINPEMSFSTFLNLVKDQCLSGYENQDAPFEKLVEKLVTDRNTSHPPLYQTSITYQDVTNREVEMGDVKLNQVEIPQNVSALDLDVWLKRTDNKLFGGIIFTTALFNKTTIVQFKNHFMALLRDVPAIIDRRIAKIQLLSENEIHSLRDLGCGKKEYWGQSETLATLFNRTFFSHPEKIAIVSEDSSLSYGELNNASNQFANYLISQKIKPGDFIGVSLDRSPMLPVILVGIFKAGAAYIPLDPEFPSKRLEYMVKDSRLAYIVTQKCHGEKFSHHIENSFYLEDISKILDKQSNQQPKIEANDCLPAYVIYTSGSTGKPKGVVVPQKAVINFLQSMKECPGLSEHDVLLAITTLSFDISVLELFLPLLTGSKIILATSSETANSNALQQLLIKHHVTVMQATPATWRMLATSSWQGQKKLKALCGGEAMPQDLMEMLLPKCEELWNMYGPTETTVWSACRKITNADQLATIIGQPIANTQLYILDQWLQPVPRGVAGELFIGGAGVSNGYLYQSELTNKTFIPNPFDKNEMLYRTGDRMRYRHDSSCEFLGRTDDQLKVRGFRIETGEIESVMRRHQQIQDCAIVVKEQRAGDARLVAYVVWENNSLTQTELRRYLRDWLPTYMIPQNVINIAELPKTPNGKLDKNNLPDIFTNIDHSTEFSTPQSDEQQWLAALWRSLIGIEKISLKDNFFDLGGHSLLSMQAIHEIHKETGIVLNPRELLLENLEQLAERITLTNDKHQQQVKSNSWQTRIKTLFRGSQK